MDKKYTAIPYFCFALVALSTVGIFTMPGGVLVSLFYVFYAALWYQTGVSFMKRRKWAWWSAGILISLFFMGTMVSVVNTIILPLITPNLTGVGIGRWIALGLVIISGYILYLLSHKSLRKEFGVYS